MFKFKLTLLLALTLNSANAASIFFNFSTGSGVLTPTWPGTGGPQPSGSNTGVNLGSSLTLVDPNSGTLTAATMTASGTLFCQVSNVAGQCASAATSESSANAGHASGLGVGNGRLDAGETITITIAPGFIARLVSFQVSAMIGPTGGANQETGFYNIGAGNVNFLGGDLGVDTITLGSPTQFTTLVFGAPSGGPNGGNTYALQGVTLDITSSTVPEPSSFALIGTGLAALGALARRRQRKS